MKLDRLLSIVIMLLNRQRVQAKDLADHFEVSTRTIYRDIEAINRAGIPVVTHQGNKGGLGIIDSYKLDRQVLTLQDMVTMLSVLKGVNSTFKDRQINNAIEKIHALVPEHKQEFVKNHVDQIVIDVMPWGSSLKHKEKMMTLQQAIAGNQVCDISYHDSNGAASHRTVEPMTLIFKATAWYLFAYCSLRNDFRLFKVNRIRNLQVLPETFTRKNGKYQHYDTMPDDSTEMISLVIRFSRIIRHTVEEYFEKSQLKYLECGDIIATFELPDNDWVISYILSLGDNAEVIKPQRLRTLLRKKAEKITRLYKRDIQVS
ncbi:MAG: YafY family transcriptional regulator [Desulfobulbus sp.]|nr:MAG: YafY family transcriptional regulator [Desulfobulbus sp.]